MEDKLIEFETAKLAKLKGFSPATIFAFRQIDNGPPSKMGYFDGGMMDWNDGMDSENGVWFSRPTQSLLQKWLRETHQIHLHIEWYTDGKWEISLVTKDLDGAPIPPKESEGSYLTYEDALEVGLLHALELLPDGVNKNQHFTK